MHREILLVEDDIELAGSVCDFLKSRNIECNYFADPREAVATARECKYPLLITDLKLPHINGIELAAKIRAHQPEIRVLIITAYSSMPTVLEALRLGVDNYLLKPFSSRELIFHVDRALERYDLVKQNQRYQKNLEQMIQERTNQLTHRQQELRTSQMENIFAIGNVIEARDPYTRGHTERVTLYAVSLAEAMGWDRSTIYALCIGSPLHDIGKISVPDAILKKNGPLTTIEYDIMKDHPGQGYDLVKDTDLHPSTVACILYHHERFDGRGYPFGLKGENIPPEGRIMAVCDAFDAMTSNRVYRKAMSTEKALEIVRQNAGAQFDPEIAKVLIDLVEENPDANLFNEGDISEEFNTLVAQLIEV